ncbi:MAG: thermonuclease family protein [Phycisphaerae bacterium]|nr:thermonuclease family protein [Phycisphaerae bacterium]
MAKRRYPKATPSFRRGRSLARRGLWGVVAVAVLAGLVAGDRLGLFGTKSTPSASAAADWETYDGKTFVVSRVVDGDTIDLAHFDSVNNKKTTRVRLWGVDTPETVQPNTPVEWFGPEASAFVKDTVQGRQVRIELEPNKKPRDKYNRLLAWVVLEDGRLLNAELISQGYGYADPRFDHHRKAEFAKRQAQAMHARIGLWQHGAPPKDLPEYYRNGRHKLPK